MIFSESGLNFQFNSDWWVKSFDQHRFYQYINGYGLKGVDFVGIYQERELYFIEVKNYKLRWAPEAERLADLLGTRHGEIIQLFDDKTDDSLRILELIHRYHRRQTWNRWYSTLMKQFYRFGWKSDFIFWQKAWELMEQEPIGKGADHINPSVTSILWMELDDVYDGISTDSLQMIREQIRIGIEEKAVAFGIQTRLVGGLDLLPGLNVNEK